MLDCHHLKKQIPRKKYEEGPRYEDIPLVEILGSYVHYNTESITYFIPDNSDQIYWFVGDNSYLYSQHKTHFPNYKPNNITGCKISQEIKWRENERLTKPNNGR